MIRRRHAVRVWRRYATIVVWGQRWARQFVAAAHRRRDVAARIIQRCLKRHRARRRYLICRPYRVRPERADRAVNTIARALNCHTWARRAHKSLRLLVLHNRRLVRAVVLAQRRYRTKLQRRPVWTSRYLLYAVVLIQSWWRGLKTRIRLRRRVPDRALQLRTIGWRLLDLQDAKFNLYQIRLALRYVAWWKRRERQLQRTRVLRERELLQALAEQLPQDNDGM